MLSSEALVLAAVLAEPSCSGAADGTTGAPLALALSSTAAVADLTALVLVEAVLGTSAGALSLRLFELRRFMLQGELMLHWCTVL